jgi:uncharacterized surface protein with fasciclin (FAS1) repeats
MNPIIRSLSSLALVAALAAPGCKKKAADDPGAAAKPAEGSGSAVVAGSGSAAPAVEAKPDPTAAKTVLDVAKDAGTFTTLLKAIDAAGLREQLSGAGPFTIFAPTDDAFAKLPPKDLEVLLADKTKLTAVLGYHVVPGKLASAELATAKTEKTVQGGELAIETAADKSIKVGGATVTKADLPAANGVIHVIDAVLQPK